MQGRGMRPGSDKRCRVVPWLDVCCVWSELAEQDALQSCILSGLLRMCSTCKLSSGQPPADAQRRTVLDDKAEFVEYNVDTPYIRYQSYMTSTVTKWGNSLAVRIPQNLARELLVEEGTEVELSVIDGVLVVKPMVQKHYTLDKLVSGITAENIHPEVDWGVAVGNEFW